MAWKIEPTDGGWWLFYAGTDGWWHVYHSNWLAIFPTLEAVFEKIKERT
jgi:hypothetical protein